MNKPQILVVEDETIVALDIKQRLTRLGYTVPALAASGAEALDKAIKTQPDLVLMDIKLKGEMDGVTAAKQIRSRFDIPVIYLTAFADGPTLQRAKMTAPYGYLLKPFEEKELYSTIEMVLHRHQLEQKLKESEQWLDATLKSVSDGIITLDAGGRIILANPKAKAYLTELTGAGIGDVLTHLGQKPIQEFLGPPPKGEFHREVILEGSPRRVFEVITQSIETGPQVDGCVLVIRDVTEKRIIQENSQQQDRLAVVGQLAAGIAHDFNNILTAIIGFTELTRADQTISQTARQNLEYVVQQGHRAAHLVRQILDFGRKSIIKKEPLDLVVTIQETIKLLRRTIPEDIDITLEIEPGREAYMVSADATRIQQVLTNLAINAHQAMLTGGALQFRLANHTLPDRQLSDPERTPDDEQLNHMEWLNLSVSDTGVGIPPEVLPHIFEPFFTTKEVGEGTGLGLAQVYGIIKQHYGEISVNSRVGQGTTFTLYLPALILPKELLQKSKQVKSPLGHRETILVVEDELVVLRVAQAMLKYLGYRVLTATNGHEALEIYGQQLENIALVLTDMVMPGMGGIELAQALQSRTPAIKIVAITGYPLEMEAKELLATGIVDWLQKPLKLEQLAQTVNRSLQRSYPNGG